MMWLVQRLKILVFEYSIKNLLNKTRENNFNQYVKQLYTNDLNISKIKSVLNQKSEIGNQKSEIKKYLLENFSSQTALIL